MNVYACSDIHGQYSLFRQMLDGISFSDDDFLYILGDVIDRGPGSIPMLQDIMGRENIICIMGNHELMMYTEYRLPGKESYWLHSSNGGRATQKDFEKLSAAEQEQTLDFIESMALQIDLEVDGTRYLLSHSDFIRERDSVLFRDVDYRVAFDTVWNSPWRMWEYVTKRKYSKDGRFHVIGHVPVQYVQENPVKTNAYIDKKHKIINIDLGCARIGNQGHVDGHSLCCMNLTAYSNGAGTDAFTYYS
ncbi:MAG: metallophosphoesterase [Lachnospiraceae bacterium]|nr:metallophosphoesterase [Lachnospiraceae bacterium]